MNWFWRYLQRKLNNQIYPDESIKLSRTIGSRDIDSEDSGLNITVRSAIGGRIVSFRHHESKTDRYSWKTYIVPDEMDFERELGKMITLESMRM